MSTAELYAPAQRHFARLEMADRQRYESWLLQCAAQKVAEEVAAERGLSGMAATYFEAGFAGCNAAVVNPRRDGMEPVFRAGRRAKSEKGMAQRCRAAASALRTQEGYSLDDWLEVEYQFRPVPWRTAM